ncbi:MAG TPA: PAS domain S-box protein [Dissulfurispiraceae bacterium]|nr:PAS domain S-box protein [Dissulfurispiraceae bacterium]
MDPDDKKALTALTESLTLLLQGRSPNRISSLHYNGSNTELAQLNETINLLIQSLADGSNFISSLSQGNLSVEPPGKLFLVSPFKQLHANLRHLTWQTQQIAKGDLNQKVDFLGEFSAAFNSLIDNLRQKKAIEDALAASEERFALAMQGANEGLWDHNLQNEKIYYSPRWKSMLGYAEDELENSVATWKRLIHPDDLESTLSLMKHYCDMRVDTYQTEFRMQHRNGHYLDILSRSLVVRDDRGEIIRIIGTHQDITDRKKAEYALSKSEKQLKDITSSLTEGIYVWSDDGDIVFMNPEAERLLGWTKAELQGRNIHNIVHNRRPDGSSLPFEACGMHNVFKTGQPFISMDEVFMRKDGSVFPVSVVASPITENGSVVAGVTAFRDITALKDIEAERDKAQATIRAHARFLQGLIEAIPNPVFCKNVQLRYVACNKAFEAFIGRDRKDIIGKSVYEMAPPDLARIYNRKDVELLTDVKQRTQVYEFRVNHADGTQHEVIFSKAVYFQNDGSVGGLIGVINDITERKHLEKEREQLIVKLQEALSQVKQLSGLLPICSSCKKIRDDKGYWNQIETYISEHSEALFSHGLCPDCGKKLYPQYFDEIWGNDKDKTEK